MEAGGERLGGRVGGGGEGGCRKGRLEERKREVRRWRCTVDRIENTGINILPLLVFTL